MIGGMLRMSAERKQFSASDAVAEELDAAVGEHAFGNILAEELEMVATFLLNPAEDEDVIQVVEHEWQLGKHGQHHAQEGHAGVLEAKWHSDKLEKRY
jgi:hypothetical protein